jgi:plastocyanin
MKTTVIVLIVVLVAAGLYYLTANRTQSPNVEQNVQNVQNVQTRVDISNFAFSPASLTVAKGSTVVWTNNDSAPHNITFDNSGIPASPTMQPGGATYSYTFTSAGTYAYHCSIHPNMLGQVVVTE